jgi:hypothetical protein
VSAPPPVFILGAHRSGTTWLTQQLAETGLFSVLTAFHVIEWAALERHQAGAGPAPDRAELAQRLHALGLSTRATDRVSVTPDTPEEYGYLLLAQGEKSWVRPQTVPLLRRVVERLQAEAPGRTVLLKNPWDYGNEDVLLGAFPDARFIAIHRHPLAVVQSSVRMFRQIWEAPDPYTALLSARYRRLWAGRWSRALFQWLASPRNAVDLHITLGGLVQSHRKHHRVWPGLPAERAVALRYEDLVVDPPAGIGRILEELGMDGGAAPQTPARPSNAPLSAELERHRRFINWRTRAYRERWGYREDGGAEPTGTGLS